MGCIKLMQSEIEAKFINANHDEMRDKLRLIGAKCEEPMRLMRRVVVHNSAMTAKNAFLRVRDEGHRVTMTYKQFDADSIDGAKELEVVVSDFDTMVAALDASGLKHDTYQESKRENWRVGGVEIMLDEWPWLNPYVEIESSNERAVRQTAEKLGLSWDAAVFGGVANVYLAQYPHIGDKGRRMINENWPIIKFDGPRPPLLEIHKDSL